MERGKGKMKKRWKQRLLSVLIPVLMIIGLLGTGIQTQAAVTGAGQTNAGEMKVHFLDVGQGLSILVQSEGKTMIYDGGDKKTSRFVVAYLKDQGVKKIDYLISSHYDADHMAGLIGCLNTFDVKHVISSNYEHNSKLYKSFVKAVKADGLKMQHPKVGKTFSFGSGSFEILAPTKIEAKGSNNNSVAIKLVNGQNSFVFTGDAEHESEAAMCASGIDLSCDVLVPGHHGSATATSWDFLQKTVPEYAVISCGKNNKYGHPDKDTMDKLQSMNIQVYRTDKQGTIIATSNGTDISWSAEACNDYTPGDESDQGTQPAGTTTAGSTGANAANAPATGSTQNTAAPSESTAAPDASAETGSTGDTSTEQVWVSATGSKYHRINNCGRMNPANARQETRAQAEAEGLEPCSKCY